MNTQKNLFPTDNMEIILEFDYTNCFDLIHGWLNIPSIISKIYKYSFHVLFAVFILSILIRPSFKLTILNLGFAVIFFLVSIGIHQFLHLIAAYLARYKNVKLVVPRANVFCYCDKQVFNSKNYIFVSILPFLAITTASLVIAILSPKYLGAVSIFNILNITSSNGDIAITNYFLKNRNKYFYCDYDKKLAYIYEII